VVPRYIGKLSFERRGRTVGHHFLKRETMLIAVALLIVSTWTIASAEEVKLQGMIMNIDLRQNTMVVNEKTFTWDQGTAIFDDRSSPITLDRFKQTAWVYIQGEKNENYKIKIRKIYLLPRQIFRKERPLYPFMDE
jgi:hypothetical protein